MLKNTDGQSIGFALVSSIGGAAVLGATVTGYKTIDGSIQEPVEGSIIEAGKGQYVFSPSLNDTNGNNIGYLFIAFGAIPVNISLRTIDQNVIAPLTYLTFVMIDATSGQGATGVDPIGFVTADKGVQVPVAGIISELGHGQYQFLLGEADKQGNDISFLFTGPNCFPVTYNFVNLAETLDAYGSINEANAYFTRKLRSECWFEASLNDQQNSLVEATELIDGLAYMGYKTADMPTVVTTSSVLAPVPHVTYVNLTTGTWPTFFAPYEPTLNQLHQFPRDGDTEIPPDIKKACFEIALKLLEGYDPDFEIENQRASSRSFGTTRTTYEHPLMMDYLRAGIPSARAWNYLRPYLRDPFVVKLDRV